MFSSIVEVIHMSFLSELLYWSPLAILLGLIVLLVIFFKTDLFRKYKIRYRIYKNRLMRFIKHLINYGKYIVKIADLLKLILYFVIFISFVVSAVLIAVFFYNQYLVPVLSKITNVQMISLSLSGMAKTLFSSRMNPFYFVGFLSGAVLSAFMRPKLEHFAVRVKSKKTVIYVFGSNEITHQFVKSICDFGFGPLIALIAEKEKPWMAEIKHHVDLLVLDNPEILMDETLYKKIEFKNALKVLVLVDSSELAQSILVNVRKVNPQADVIILSRNKPPLLDFVGNQIENITVLDDIDLTSRELVRRLSIGFMYANAVEVLVPKDYVGRRPEDIEHDFNHRIKVLAVKRKGRIYMPEKLEMNDILILYLVDIAALREFLQLLPISPFEEVKVLAESELEPAKSSEKGEGDGSPKDTNSNSEKT